MFLRFLTIALFIALMMTSVCLPICWKALLTLLTFPTSTFICCASRARAGTQQARIGGTGSQTRHLMLARARSFTPPPTFQNIAEKKDMRSSFFGAVSSGSGHRSVGYHRPCGRRRSETKSSGRGPWDVGLCVVRVSASGEYCAECLGIFVVCLPGHHGGHMRGFSG